MLIPSLPGLACAGFGGLIYWYEDIFRGPWWNCKGQGAFFRGEGRQPEGWIIKSRLIIVASMAIVH